MSKTKLIGWALLIGVISFGIYQSCCATPPVEIRKAEVQRLAEQRFLEYLHTNGLLATAFKREDIWFDDKVRVWNVVYRNLPGQKDRIVSILVGEYGGVEMHALGPKQ
jgi:hypothetical protein